MKDKGLMKRQGTRTKGEGRMMNRICMYDRRSRRLTTTKWIDACRSDPPFLKVGGAHHRFTQTYFMPKIAPKDFVPSELDAFIVFMFPNTIQEVWANFPQCEQHSPCNGALRTLWGKFTCVG